jgi:hypothetical protein
MKIDRLGNEMGGLGFGHFLTHAGKMFHCAFGWSAIAAAQTKVVGILTGTKELHLKGININALGTWAVSIIEAPTGVTAGTAFVPWNRSRLGTPAACSAVFKIDVTGTTGGTEFTMGNINAGTGVVSETSMGGSEGGWDDEIILKPSTQYVLKLLSGATTGNAANVRFPFVEI